MKFGTTGAFPLDENTAGRRRVQFVDVGAHLQLAAQGPAPALALQALLGRQHRLPVSVALLRVHASVPVSWTSIAHFHHQRYESIKHVLLLLSLRRYYFLYHLTERLVVTVLNIALDILCTVGSSLTRFRTGGGVISTKKITQKLQQFK